DNLRSDPPGSMHRGRSGLGGCSRCGAAACWRGLNGLAGRAESMSDVVDLRAFYGEPLGQVAGRILRAKIRGVWPSVAGERVLGFGYTVPYLGQFRDEAERTVALMPAQQGAVVWPPGARSATGLIDPEMWPLQDEMFDRI